MKFIKAKIWSIIVVVVLLIVIVSLYFIFRNNNIQTVKVVRGNLDKITEISGKVVPTEEVDLSFGVGGNVAKIYANVGSQVKAGDLIAVLDKSEITSEIGEATASLESENSKLNDITGSNNYSSLNVKKDAFIKTLNKAEINADGIIKNQVDTFFDNPASRFPEFNIALGDYFVRQDLSEERFKIEKMLTTWKKNLSNLNNSNVTIADGNETIANLKVIESFLGIIAKNAYSFEPTGDTTQSQIDSYLATVATARSSVASLIIEINTSIDSLRAIEANIPVQSAMVENSRATVSKLFSRSTNYEIRAPFDGIITSKDIEVGQTASVGVSAFKLISNLPLEIEAYIPEVSVVGIDVGDFVKTTFDAIGKEFSFDAIVAEIEPKETIKDGVTTYKIRADLKEENKNLKPGMSADLEIHKEVIADQIIIPTYVVFKENGNSFVNVLKNRKIEKRQIEIADKDNRGNYSIKSGLEVGEEVVIPN